MVHLVVAVDAKVHNPESAWLIVRKLVEGGDYCQIIVHIRDVVLLHEAKLLLLPTRIHLIDLGVL